MNKNISKVNCKNKNNKETTFTDQIIGRRIYQSRVHLNISRQELANIIGITQQQLYKYEKGKNRVAASRLILIAQKLNKKIQDFFS